MYGQTANAPKAGGYDRLLKKYFDAPLPLHDVNTFVNQRYTMVRSYMRCVLNSDREGPRLGPEARKQPHNGVHDSILNVFNAALSYLQCRFIN